MANNPREVWSQMQPETPFSRYPVANPQPSPGIAGVIQAVGQGAGNALAYRRQLEAQVQAAAAKVAEMEAKALQEAAAAKAEQEAKRQLEFDLLKARGEQEIKMEGERRITEKEKVGELKKAGAYSRGGPAVMTPAQKAQVRREAGAAMDKAVAEAMGTTTKLVPLTDAKGKPAVDARGNVINVQRDVTRGVADLSPEARKFYEQAKPWALAAAAGDVKAEDALARIDVLKPKTVSKQLLPFPWVSPAQVAASDDVETAYGAVMQFLTPGEATATNLSNLSPAELNQLWGEVE